MRVLKDGTDDYFQEPGEIVVTISNPRITPLAAAENLMLFLEGFLHERGIELQFVNVQPTIRYQGGIRFDIEMKTPVPDGGAPIR